MDKSTYHIFNKYDIILFENLFGQLSIKGWCKFQLVVSQVL
jgi:hypothetical protein